jgi:hypothetical protein
MKGRKGIVDQWIVTLAEATVDWLKSSVQR